VARRYQPGNDGAVPSRFVVMQNFFEELRDVVPD